MHPCFNNMSTMFSPEARGDGTRSAAIKITGYLSQRAEFGEGMVGSNHTPISIGHCKMSSRSGLKTGLRSLGSRSVRSPGTRTF